MKRLQRSISINESNNAGPWIEEFLHLLDLTSMRTEGAKKEQRYDTKFQLMIEV